MKELKKKLKHLYGFRSGVPWKEIVAGNWYVISAAALFILLTTPPLVPASVWDRIVLRLSGVVIFLWMMSPAIFLSDTALRARLPFLKNNTHMGTLAGFLIVMVVFTVLFRFTEALHTPEYLETFGAYLAASNEQFIAAGTVVP